MVRKLDVFCTTTTPYVIIVKSEEIAMSFLVSVNLLIAQHFEALNASAIMGIQRASVELLTQHTAESQVLVSEVWFDYYHLLCLSFVYWILYSMFCIL